MVPGLLTALIGILVVTSSAILSRSPTAERSPADAWMAVEVDQSAVDAVVDGPGVAAEATADSVPAPTAVPPVVASAPPPRRPVVAIDPGHGGPDDDLPRYREGRLIPWYREGYNTGVIHVWNDGSELREKDLVLQLALAAAERLRKRDVVVALTRTEDVMVNEQNRDFNDDGKVDVADDLLARVQKVNESGADVLVSIHINGHPSSSLRGTYTQFSYGRPFTDESIRLAATVHERVVKNLRDVPVETDDRGVEDDTQHDPTGRHLILFGARTERGPIQTEVPGALIEALFLTNREDAILLERADVLDAISAGIANGILEFLGMSEADDDAADDAGSGNVAADESETDADP